MYQNLENLEVLLNLFEFGIKSKLICWILFEQTALCFRIGGVEDNFVSDFFHLFWAKFYFLNTRTADIYQNMLNHRTENLFRELPSLSQNIPKNDNREGGGVKFLTSNNLELYQLAKTHQVI